MIGALVLEKDEFRNVVAEADDCRKSGWNDACLMLGFMTKVQSATGGSLNFVCWALGPSMSLRGGRFQFFDTR